MYFQVVEPSDIRRQTGLGTPHTSHCLGSGEIMISSIGDGKDNPKGTPISHVQYIRVNHARCFQILCTTR